MSASGPPGISPGTTGNPGALNTAQAEEPRDGEDHLANRAQRPNRSQQWQSLPPPPIRKRQTVQCGEEVSPRYPRTSDDGANSTPVTRQGPGARSPSRRLIRRRLDGTPARRQGFWTEPCGWGSFLLRRNIELRKGVRTCARLVVAAAALTLAVLGGTLAVSVVSSPIANGQTFGLEQCDFQVRPGVVSSGCSSPPATCPSDSGGCTVVARVRVQSAPYETPGPGFAVPRPVLGALTVLGSSGTCRSPGVYHTPSSDFRECEVRVQPEALVPPGQTVSAVGTGELAVPEGEEGWLNFLLSGPGRIHIFSEIDLSPRAS